ncbi:MAG: OadG family protein [Tissierellales bacterium]
MFSEIITINESLVITAFSMLLVFAALIGLSFTIDGFRVLAHSLEKKNKNKSEPVASVNESVANPVVQDITSQEDDLELVAVITASIAAMLSRSANSIVVRNIVRVPQTTPVWGSISRQEIVNK